MSEGRSFSGNTLASPVSNKNANFFEADWSTKSSLANSDPTPISTSTRASSSANTNMAAVTGINMVDMGSPMPSIDTIEVSKFTLPHKNVMMAWSDIHPFQLFTDPSAAWGLDFQESYDVFPHFQNVAGFHRPNVTCAPAKIHNMEAAKVKWSIPPSERQIFGIIPDTTCPAHNENHWCHKNSKGLITLEAPAWQEEPHEEPHSLKEVTKLLATEMCQSGEIGTVLYQNRERQKLLLPKCPKITELPLNHISYTTTTVQAMQCRYYIEVAPHIRLAISMPYAGTFTGIECHRIFMEFVACLESSNYTSGIVYDVYTKERLSPPRQLQDAWETPMLVEENVKMEGFNLWPVSWVFQLMAPISESPNEKILQSRISSYGSKRTRYGPKVANQTHL